MESGRVIGHEVVVEVVVAAHSDEEYAASHHRSHRGGAEVSSYLVEGVLEVPYLLIEGYASDLHMGHVVKSSMEIKISLN